jgi:hypothetical protein
VDDTSVELEVGTPGNARTWAECQVLTHGGQLHESAEAPMCGAVIRSVAEEALRESRRESRPLERFMDVLAPGVCRRLAGEVGGAGLDRRMCSSREPR